MAKGLNNLIVRRTVHISCAELIALGSNLICRFYDLICGCGLLRRAISLSTTWFQRSHNSNAQDETECHRILFRFEELHYALLICMLEISYIVRKRDVEAFSYSAVCFRFGGRIRTLCFLQDRDAYYLRVSASHERGYSHL